MQGHPISLAWLATMRRLTVQSGLPAMSSDDSGKISISIRSKPVSLSQCLSLLWCLSYIILVTFDWRSWVSLLHTVSANTNKVLPNLHSSLASGFKSALKSRSDEKKGAGGEQRTESWMTWNATTARLRSGVWRRRKSDGWTRGRID